MVKTRARPRTRARARPRARPILARPQANDLTIKSC